MSTHLTNEKLLAAVSYLGGPFTGIPLLIFIRKSSFVRFHAMQSSIVFGVILLFYIILGIVPIIGWLIALLLSPVFFIVSGLLCLFLIWKAISGEKYRLPYFGDVADRQLAKLL
jgi:uncharacterized membrane protein